MAKFAFTGFDATIPNYRLWVVPGVLVVLFSALSTRDRRVRALATAAAFALIGSEAVASVRLATLRSAVNLSPFAHGPHRPIASVVRALGPERVAVVLDDTSPHFVFVACPLLYEFGPSLRQYRPLNRDPHSPVVGRFLGVGRDDEAPGLLDVREVETIPGRYLVVVRCEFTPMSALRKAIRSGTLPLSEGPLAGRLRRARRWRALALRKVVALDSAVITVFESSELDELADATGRHPLDDEKVPVPVEAGVVRVDEFTRFPP